MLLIDLGNSRVKWAYARDLPRGLVHVSAWDASDPYRGLLEAIMQADEGAVGICVRDPSAAAALDARCRTLGCPPPRWLQTPAGMLGGITVGYADPGSFGADRFASLLGARARSPDPAVIVDCGTAATVDALGADGRHLGGLIFPGLSTMRRALAESTARLGGWEETSDLFARSTRAGIGAGTLRGLAAAVEGLAATMADALGPRTQYLLSGGDAERLRPLLRSPFVHAPNLVFEGLERWAREG
jgi:type III pantothenate kinase